MLALFDILIHTVGRRRSVFRGSPSELAGLFRCSPGFPGCASVISELWIDLTLYLLIAGASA